MLTSLFKIILAIVIIRLYLMNNKFQLVKFFSLCRPMILLNQFIENLQSFFLIH